MNTNISFHSLRSWAVYEGPIKKALHSIKYKGNLALGESIARPAVEYIKRLSWKVDLVIPVPLSRKRLMERGYNQVALMALPLAIYNNWKYSSNALIRIKDTQSQVGLSILDRRENVIGVFLASHKQVKDKIILLVDDVATTGSTVNACSIELLRCGAKKVYAFTMARALPRHGLQYI